MKRERKNRKENTVDMAFKGVLYPNEAQKVQIEKTFGCCRYVYNRFLNERMTAYQKEGKTLSYTQQSRSLTVLKEDPLTEWLKETAPRRHLASVSFCSPHCKNRHNVYSNRAKSKKQN